MASDFNSRTRTSYRMTTFQKLKESSEIKLKLKA